MVLFGLIAIAPKIISGFSEGTFAHVKHIGSLAIVVGGNHFVFSGGLFECFLVGIVGHVLFEDIVFGGYLFGSGRLVSQFTFTVISIFNFDA